MFQGMLVSVGICITDGEIVSIVPVGNHRFIAVARDDPFSVGATNGERFPAISVQ